MAENKENESPTKILIKTSDYDWRVQEGNDDFCINTFWNKVTFDTNPKNSKFEDSDSKIRIPLRTLNLNSNIFNEFPPTSKILSKVRKKYIQKGNETL